MDASGSICVCVCVCFSLHMCCQVRKFFTHVFDLICHKLHDPISWSSRLPSRLPSFPFKNPKVLQKKKRKKEKPSYYRIMYQSGTQRSFVILRLSSSIYFSPPHNSLHPSVAATVLLIAQSLHHTSHPSIIHSFYSSVILRRQTTRSGGLKSKTFNFQWGGLSRERETAPSRTCYSDPRREIEFIKS